jgi:poly(glycerol-phosphate) alpha-glucosyltransferase
MPAAAPSVEGARTVLFLARLVRQKGVEELIEAWSRAADAASSGGWRLRIVGWGEASFVDRLRTMAACADRRAPVDIEGPAFGKDKDRLWRDAAALVLPSRAEGLPMSVLEAWARGRAVLMSEACNLPDGFAEGAALPLSAEIASIEAALRAFFALTDSDRAAMGRAGRRLVERRYTWDRVGQQMVAVYAWLLGGGSPPSCVMTD